MYKGKLQELSQQKRWGLPMYTSMKDGPDHLPHYTASAHVNGLSFHSPTISTSSRHAHNLAAKLAFLHFSSDTETMGGGRNTVEEIQSSESQSSALAVANCCSTPGDEQPRAGATYHNVETCLHASSDLQYQYKSQLLNYTRSKNLDAPLYSSKSDGPPHAPRFNATVTIGGHRYESPEFFNTLKKAEHAAANVALKSLLQDDFQEEDSGFHKNVLHELAQKELFCTPTYQTVKYGPSHMPTFISTVEVDGEIFYGKAGKSKKQAEMKAAKVAYAAYKDREFRQRVEIASSDFPANEVLNSPATLVQGMIVDSQQNLKPQLPLLSPPPISYEEHAEERKGEVQKVNSADISSASSKATSQGTCPSSVILDIDNTEGGSTTCAESVPVAHKEDSFPTMAPLGLSASSTEMTKNMSYLLCGRVRVYRCFPDVCFPKEITVMPISEDKWVAISLEFPNETGH